MSKLSNFQMPVGVFRASCITGPKHASVELHGYLHYIISCAVRGYPYVIYGHKGKQVRDQIHARDLAALFVEFFKRPQNGEVFNVGGGRKNSISVIETIEFFASAGFRLSYDYNPTARKGGHICYITDLGRVQRTFP